MTTSRDRQADLTVHCGPDKAVYAYAAEENLPIKGVGVSGAVLGERWRVGATLLEVVQPRGRPDHGVSVRLLSDAMPVDHSLIPRARQAPQLIDTPREQMAVLV